MGASLAGAGTPISVLHPLQLPVRSGALQAACKRQPCGSPARSLVACPAYSPLLPPNPAPTLASPPPASPSPPGPLSVWAHGPPAQLCSADVASALAGACQLTAVVVGDDASPRASLAALGRLAQQAVVGLARLRCVAPRPPPRLPPI